MKDRKGTQEVRCRKRGTRTDKQEEEMLGGWEDRGREVKGKKKGKCQKGGRKKRIKGRKRNKHKNQDYLFLEVRTRN